MTTSGVTFTDASGKKYELEEMLANNKAAEILKEMSKDARKRARVRVPFKGGAAELNLFKRVRLPEQRVLILEFLNALIEELSTAHETSVSEVCRTYGITFTRKGRQTGVNTITRLLKALADKGLVAIKKTTGIGYKITNVKLESIKGSVPSPVVRAAPAQADRRQAATLAGKLARLFAVAEELGLMDRITVTVHSRRE